MLSFLLEIVQLKVMNSFFRKTDSVKGACKIFNLESLFLTVRTMINFNNYFQLDSCLIAHSRGLNCIVVYKNCRNFNIAIKKTGNNA